MKKKKLPKSLRKYIRKEKARIRREILDLKEQEKLTQELYQKIASEKHSLPPLSGEGVTKCRCTHANKK